MTKTTIHTKPENVHSTNRSSAGVIDRQNSLGAHVCVQRDADALGVQPHAPALVREVLNSPGQPLDAETRTFMEPRFGYDFSGVRVHTDQKAAESAHAFNANAYTTGTHITFGAGRYARNESSRRLIAHELTHVVQQSRGEVDGTSVADGLYLSNPSDPFEKAACAQSRNVEATQEGATEGRRALRSVPSDAIRVQRDTWGLTTGTGMETTNEAASLGAYAGVGSAIGGLMSGVAGIFSAVYAHEQAQQARRQADIAQEQLGEAQEQNRVGRLALGVSERQAEAAENPPVPTPTTGGVVINNGSGHVDIPTSEAPRGSPARAGQETESRWKLLRVSQGVNNFATFVASVRHDGKDIKGGNFEDGESKGYLGGSEGSNLSLSLRATAGPGVPGPRPRSPVASIRILASGTNSTPRTRDGRPLPGYQLQRFSGNIRVNALGGLDAPPFSVNPGGQPQVTGNGKDTPIVDINLADTTTPARQPANPEWEAGVRPGTRAAGGGHRP